MPGKVLCGRLTSASGIGQDTPMVRIQWILLGLLAGPAGFYIFSFFHFRQAWIAHAVAIGLVAAVAAAVIATRRTPWGSRVRFAAFSDFIIEAAITFSFCVVGSAASLLSVTQHAKSTAAESPYCIQVADGRGDYKPAGAWLDFSGATMWAESNGSLRMQHHAVLITENETEPRLYHWSYRKQEFVPGVLNERTNGTAVTCIPTKNFIEGLSVVFPQKAENQYVRFSKQEAYLIPAIYQPRWSVSGSKSLIIAVTPPDFKPLTTPWDDLPPIERDHHWVIMTDNPKWLLSVMSHTPTGQIIDRGTEFGLQKRSIIVDGRDGKKYEGAQYWIYGDEQGGALNTTFVSCSPGNDQFPPSCQHRFLNKGRHFYFVHRPHDVPRWQEMQKQVLALLASFEIH
jgi:hypothetical protein